MKKKAFTLIEIMVCVVLAFLVLGVVYKVFSGTFNQFFKSSNKMTNLRDASLILERLKSDVRCAVIPVAESEEAVIKENEFSFYTTVDNATRRKVSYTYNGKELKREISGESNRNINKATVTAFKVEKSEEEGMKFIKISIEVDNEQAKSSRSVSSQKNKVLLTAILYPRFFDESLTDEERYWYLTHVDSEGD